MEKFSLYVGLDVGKKSFYVSIRSDGKPLFNSCYTNDVKGISSFIKELLSYKVEPKAILVSMEHCGVYLEKIVMALHGVGVGVWLWNPIIAKHAPLELTRHKDDPRDAQSMALLCERYWDKATLYIAPSPALRQLKELFLTRRQLVKQRTQLYNQRDANRNKAVINPLSSQIHEQLIEIFSANIKLVEKEIKQLVFSKENLKRIYIILTSIPGIGPITAFQLIVVTQGFTAFQSHKQLSKYIGIMPLIYSSGTSVNKKPRSSKKANKHLKVNLTMGAVSQIRKGMFFHKFYQHKKEMEKKAHLQLINSIRNTILKLAFKLVQQNQVFDKEIFLANKKSWKNFLTLS